MSGDLDGPDGHCHVDGGAGGGADILQFVSFEDLGVGVVVADFLGFTITLLGQLRSGGLFDLYFGDDVVSEELIDSLLLAGSVHRAD